MLAIVRVSIDPISIKFLNRVSWNLSGIFKSIEDVFLSLFIFICDHTYVKKYIPIYLTSVLPLINVVNLIDLFYVAVDSSVQIGSALRLFASIALNVNCSNFFENATGVLELFTKQLQLLQTAHIWFYMNFSN